VCTAEVDTAEVDTVQVDTVQVDTVVATEAEEGAVPVIITTSNTISQTRITIEQIEEIREKDILS